MPYRQRHRRRERDDWNYGDRMMLEFGLDVFQFPGIEPHFDLKNPETFDVARECWRDLRLEMIDESIRHGPAQSIRAVGFRAAAAVRTSASYCERSIRHRTRGRNASAKIGRRFRDVRAVFAAA